MYDKKRTIRWINTMLTEAAKLDQHTGIEMLHACGAQCSMTSELLPGAEAIRKQHKEGEDTDVLFEAFKKKYYDSPKFRKEGNRIILVFEACTCPMVKDGLKNPFLCNCTVGYTIKIFEALFGGAVKVNLKKSILRGADICEQEIFIGDTDG